MKKQQYILILLLIFNSLIYSQKDTNPNFYLNNEKINFHKTFINAKNIDSMNVSKKTKNGAIFIYTKSKPFEFWTFSEVLKNHTNIEKIDDFTLVKINGKLIPNLNNLKIDKSYFIQSEIDTIANIEYLEKKYRKLKILNIKLSSEKKDLIKIKGI